MVLAMQPRAIHQFHSGSAVGDGVTNSLLFTRTLLREMGFQSSIYVEHVAPGLRGDLFPHTAYRGASDQVLLVHHSMGHDQTAWLLGLPDRKILVYHNITPLEHAPDELTRRYIQLGRTQLSTLRPQITSALAQSQYNAIDLEKYGYRQAAVVPLVEDVAARQAAPFRTEIVQQNAPWFTLLFVGRLVRHKCQHELIRLFTQIQPWLGWPSQLVLIGGYDVRDAYYGEVQGARLASGIADRIHLTGKVTDEDLWAWYRAADIFACLSEHEGFCVPLLEAMAFDVPIVAYKSSAVPETLGLGGLLFDSKDDLTEMAVTIKLLAEDRALRRAVLAGQRAQLDSFSRERIKARLAEHLAAQGIQVPVQSTPSTMGKGRLACQIEGPVETSYSLALVNRELAIALAGAQPGRVGVFVTEGPGDYVPNQALLRQHPGLEELCRAGCKGGGADVVIRNLFPPRVADMDGFVNLLSFAWEESGVPAVWIDDFNRHLDGIVTPSRFVKKTLVDNGFCQPIAVVGHGVDHFERVAPKPLRRDLGTGFRFLHVSSCLPRKGVDVLLKAYVTAFKPNEELTLVIKTFPNIHNTVAAQIEALQKQHGRMPRIVLLNEELDAAEMLELYRQCHAFVAPSRGEGFGLPLAEAMVSGLPIITAGQGGQRDFCTPDNSALVEFRFARAQTHLSTPTSLWFEPDEAHLGRLMRAAYETPPEAARRRSTEIQRWAREHLRWDLCAARVTAFAEALRCEPPLQQRPRRIGWVSTWNTRCGLATYSRYLAEALEPGLFDVRVFADHATDLTHADEPFVKRCWHQDFKRSEQRALVDAIMAAGCEAVVFQFNFGFFGLRVFADMIEQLTARGVSVLTTLHCTTDLDKPGHRASLREITDALRKCHRLLVHSAADVNRLLDFGLVDNVTLFPHGFLPRPRVDRGALKERLGLGGRTVIASYGFLLRHKGIPELVTAFAAVHQSQPDAVLLLVNACYPGKESEGVRNEYCAQARQLGVEANVIGIHKFLSDAESLALLGAADLVVFPYQHTAESASGAVRLALSAGAPVACTPLEIFDDVRPVTLRLPGTTPQEIAAGLLDILRDEGLPVGWATQQDAWLWNCSWSRCALRLKAMLLDAARGKTQ